MSKHSSFCSREPSCKISFTSFKPPLRLINGSSGELKKIINPDPYISPFNKNNTNVSCLSPKETDAFRFIYLFNDGKQQKLLGCCLPSCQCRPGIICCLPAEVHEILFFPSRQPHCPPYSSPKPPGWRYTQFNTAPTKTRKSLQIKA